MKFIAKLKNGQGIALILTIMLMTLILFLCLYLLNFSLTEDRIAKSQISGVKTYYLAEAGVQEMIWKLKNDQAYSQNFITDPDWTQTFTRVDPFGPESGSYTVSITNTSLAHGEITASGLIPIGGGKYSQRIVKTKIYKALGDSIMGDITGYGDHDIEISNGRLNIYNGGTHANHDFKVKNSSAVYIEKDLDVVHDLSESSDSTVTVGGAVHSSQNPPAADSISMFAIDFDSQDSSSYKNRADASYSASQFSDLMQNNQNLTIDNEITYVTGDVDVNGAQNLTINGILVVSHDFTVGGEQCWSGRCGYNSITINSIDGRPAGILVKHDIELDQWSGDILINGLLYASHELSINNLTADFSFNINGAALGGHDLNINSSQREINITKDNSTINGIIGSAEFSPIIMVEHWEEEY